ncbi:MAG: SDR family oxidoreductase [Rhodospirillaceae bacterium]
MNPIPSGVLIVGAASDIGLALAREYAGTGASLTLAARNVLRLAADASDLRIRHQVDVRLVEFDILDVDEHQAFIHQLGPAPDVVLCVVGVLGDQARAQANPQTADLIMRTNYNCPSLLMDALAARMEARGSGVLVGISSVAGDRGRASNYIYGSAKAGFTAFLSGLRNRFAKTGIRVVTVKPGFVNTRMTAGLRLPRRLTAEPQAVAEAIARAVRSKRDILYVLPIWRLIMTIIRVLPESIFKKTAL